jgi:hypothetical protein
MVSPVRVYGVVHRARQITAHVEKLDWGMNEV